MSFDAVEFLERLVSDKAESTTSDPRLEPIPVADHPADGAALVETPSGGIYPADLPQAWRELHEERAAIREFDGWQAREHAETGALKEILKRMQECS